MKAYLVAALTCLTVMGSMAACSDDVSALLPGISVGESPVEYSGAEIAANAEMICSGGCDGVLEDPTASASKAVTYPDNDALREMVLFFGVSWLYFNEIEDTDTYMDKIAGLEEETELTFNTTRTTNCNATGTEGGGLGDASDGVIVETFVGTRTYDSMGVVEGTDREYWRTFTFVNCLIAGDLLDEMGAGVGNGSAIRLNGTLRLHSRSPAEASPSDPFLDESHGQIFLSTDQDDDGTFGREFWTHVVNINALKSYDGETSGYNGGMCAGEAVKFGTGEGADQTEEDDGCAADTDGADDAFWPASQVAGC
ncbi:MAG: hypothetical protein KDH09_20075 [Chrysiogenetes bacterium]|nr:hypothetical protein [Chrysiogenetes bacterium]